MQWSSTKVLAISNGPTTGHSWKWHSRWPMAKCVYKKWQKTVYIQIRKMCKKQPFKQQGERRTRTGGAPLERTMREQMSISWLQPMKGNPHWSKGKSWKEGIVVSWQQSPFTLEEGKGVRKEGRKEGSWLVIVGLKGSGVLIFVFVFHHLNLS